ncbi:PleD family two-component system response regulator [Pararhizobium haloflavum]|uniref:PleD family two-component system response regulator n=1 Tax=Pararhizobium haloflavum TaxID=2037914 RepID=UPI000C19BE13|nr:PleD family two-component system response regulator [Pararhizobium haloflavum]
MTARILVVDDVPANIKLLEARLLADYFDVLTAQNGADALAICRRAHVDLILLDIMMPEMDGFEVCGRLKSDPRTAHIPVVMVTALDQPEDRVRGLEAGADEFLTKPVNDLQLMTRVRSLLRLKTLTDELRIRAETAHLINTQDMLNGTREGEREPGHVLLVDERVTSQERVTRILEPIAEVVAMSDPQAALFEAAERPYDLVVVSDNFSAYDPLRLCSQLRSVERTRFLPLMLIAKGNASHTVTRGLELGVNDYILRPLDGNELLARVSTQIRRKRYDDYLRRSVRETIELAVTDGLTGLHNRRYLDSHIQSLIERAAARSRPLSICMADIDRFKAINDTHGHEAGDDVLRELARRIRQTVRGADLACRYGGEEFVVVMPDTDAALAESVAERLRVGIESAPFFLKARNLALPVTASLGTATLRAGELTPEPLFRRADDALYTAKRTGRNKVVANAA